MDQDGRTAGSAGGASASRHQPACPRLGAFLLTERVIDRFDHASRPCSIGPRGDHAMRQSVLEMGCVAGRGWVRPHIRPFVRFAPAPRVDGGRRRAGNLEGGPETRCLFRATTHRSGLPCRRTSRILQGCSTRSSSAVAPRRSRTPCRKPTSRPGASRRRARSADSSPWIPPRRPLHSRFWNGIRGCQRAGPTSEPFRAENRASPAPAPPCLVPRRQRRARRACLRSTPPSARTTSAGLPTTTAWASRPTPHARPCHCGTPRPSTACSSGSPCADLRQAAERMWFAWHGGSHGSYTTLRPAARRRSRARRSDLRAAGRALSQPASAPGTPAA